MIGEVSEESESIEEKTEKWTGYAVGFVQFIVKVDLALQTEKAALEAAFKDERLPLAKENFMKRTVIMSFRLSEKILHVLLLILFLLLSCCS